MPSTATAVRATPRAPKPPAGRTEQLIASPSAIVPSAPRNFPLHRPRRADENVRRTRSDEAVDELAASIRAHGLLQSLIGYEQKIGGYAEPRIMIVGGGRRLKALAILEEEQLIDEDWQVPVLIRDRDQALELSLAENLEHKNMSPVDEFFAFKALIDTGRFDAAELAKRFGFSERTVRQRLRLADLHPDIIDALANRAITLDAAMAYAASQDQALQRHVFTAHCKPNAWEAHQPARIKRDLRDAGADTGHRLFKFVGAKEYETAGGGYEDDLFDGVGPNAERRLTAPHLLEQLAHERLDRSQTAIIRELRGRADLSPSIEALVRIRGLVLASWHTPADLPPPDGFVAIDKHASHLADPCWRTIRNNKLRAAVAIGIDHEGKVQPYRDMLFVEPGQRAALEPPPGPRREPAGLSTDQALARGAVELAAAQPVAAHERERGIRRWQRRLALPRVAGTEFEGRTFYGADYPQAFELNGEAGQLIELQVWASNAAIAAQAEAAAAEYDAETARIAAGEAADDEEAEAVK